MTGDETIISADRKALAIERGANISSVRCRFRSERQDLEKTRKSLDC